MNNYQDNSSNNTNASNQNSFNNTVPPVNNTPVQAIHGSSIPFHPMKEETTIVPNANISNDTYQNNIPSQFNSVPTNVSSNITSSDPFTDPNTKTYVDILNKGKVPPEPISVVPTNISQNNISQGNTITPIPNQENVNNSNINSISNNPNNITNSMNMNGPINSETSSVPNPSINSNNIPAYNDTSINDLNIQGNYNNPESDYRQDPQIIANLNPNKKKTVTITGELKLVIIIALILFIFILVIPFIFDFISEIKY